MQYPLDFTFKFWSLTPQMTIADAQGNPLFYVRQKIFKLKEVINVFADVERSQELFTIKADRIIDFSARYNFSDPTGKVIGAVKRRGMKSLWKAHFDIFDGENIAFTIEEENPWVKVIDSLVADLPFGSFVTGYLFNPTYLVSRSGAGVVMKLSKRPTFWSRKFIIHQVDQVHDREQTQILLSLMMMILLERGRG
ncbi:MAG: hypothetical protein KME18_10075 [Phormidium tanganyikae FI6-MK23]|jgi:uncharacterized protein YxjI|nr:hypothetical protein [Phormidium tanganyikae FI6-MK23]